MWTSASRSMLQSDLAVISVCVSRSQSPFINSLYHINLHKGVAMFYTHLQCKCTKPLFWSQLSLFVLDSSWYFSGPIRPIRSMALSGMRGISALSDVSQMTWQWMTRWHSQTVFYWQISPFACVVHCKGKTGDADLVRNYLRSACHPGLLSLSAFQMQQSKALDSSLHEIK